VRSLSEAEHFSWHQVRILIAGTAYRNAGAVANGELRCCDECGGVEIAGEASLVLRQIRIGNSIWALGSIAGK